MKSTCGCPRRRIWLLIVVLATLALAWIFFRQQIMRPLSVRVLLSSDAPREEAFYELAEQSRNPAGFLNRCWATGRIVHRQFVAQYLKSCAATNPPWLADAWPLVLAGATDADMSVRELSLATLENSHRPDLFEKARLQLADADPLIRRMGVDYLRKLDSRKATPLLVSMLDDADLRVATDAEATLARWTGVDFGVRQRLAIAPAEGPRAGLIDQANLDLIRAGISRRKEWWHSHAADYSTTQAVNANATAGASNRPAVSDFHLATLDGKTARLADFRGKVVLINFWTTWCSACLAEIPDLIELQKEAGDKLVILGISLDGVPDEHEHEAGAAPAETREKVARTVKLRGMNYPILLDPKSSVGARFNGGELPTTVIIDPQGRLCRRFVGERNLAVFREMIRQAAVPDRAANTR